MRVAAIPSAQLQAQFGTHGSPNTSLSSEPDKNTGAYQSSLPQNAAFPLLYDETTLHSTSGTEFSSGLGSVRLTVGFNDLDGLFQP